MKSISEWLKLYEDWSITSLICLVFKLILYVLYDISNNPIDRYTIIVIITTAVKIDPVNVLYDVWF